MRQAIAIDYEDSGQPVRLTCDDMELVPNVEDDSRFELIPHADVHITYGDGSFRTVIYHQPKHPFTDFTY